MLYCIIGEDHPNHPERRQSARQAHLARLEQLQSEGRLITAGPFPNADQDEAGSQGFSGSLILAEFDSLASAQAWANEDPYVAAEVYKQVTVKPFKKVF